MGGRIDELDCQHSSVAMATNVAIEIRAGSPIWRRNEISLTRRPSENRRSEIIILSWLAAISAIWFEPVDSSTRAFSESSLLPTEVTGFESAYSTYVFSFVPNYVGGLQVTGLVD